MRAVDARLDRDGPAHRAPVCSAATSSSSVSVSFCQGAALHQRQTDLGGGRQPQRQLVQQVVLAKEGGRRAGEDRPTAGQGHDPVGQQHLVHLLGHEHHRQAAIGFAAHGRQHLVAAGRVEHRGRLVEHEHAPWHGQHAGQAQCAAAGRPTADAARAGAAPRGRSVRASRRRAARSRATAGRGSRGRRPDLLRWWRRRAGCRGSGTARRRRGARRSAPRRCRGRDRRPGHGRRPPAGRARRAVGRASTCPSRWRRPRRRTHPRRPPGRCRAGRRRRRLRSGSAAPRCRSATCPHPPDRLSGARTRPKTAKGRGRLRRPRPHASVWRSARRARPARGRPSRRRRPGAAPA